MENGKVMPGCKTALITGGCGFVGRKLSAALLDTAGFALVILFDLQLPSEPLRQQGEVFVRGSTTDPDRLAAALAAHGPVSVVFHVAAWGMSGAASLDKARTWHVNVEGTRNVIAACHAAGVPRLVYTSTCNAVFGGQPIVDGQEASLPYTLPHQHLDHYSRSKTAAEQLVLAANGSRLADTQQAAGNAAASNAAAAAGADVGAAGGGVQLRTCALRPNGIFGAGEQQHSMRVLRMAEAGVFKATFGSLDSVQAWTHINNLVQAQLLAADALTAERGFIAAGQAYFIVDREATNSQLFLRPLLEGLGYKWPSLQLPVWPMYLLAGLCELLYQLLPRRLGFQPPLTRNEVRKTVVTHTFSIAKAERELGYQPESHSPCEYLPWFLERGFGRQPGQNKLLLQQQQEQQEEASSTAAVPAVSAQKLRWRGGQQQEQQQHQRQGPALAGNRLGSHNSSSSSCAAPTQL